VTIVMKMRNWNLRKISNKRSMSDGVDQMIFHRNGQHSPSALSDIYVSNVGSNPPFKRKTDSFLPMRTPRQYQVWERKRFESE